MSALIRRILHRQEALPSNNEILQSFDGQDWANAFVSYVRQNPAIATDKETMTGWFANALMRGYDEHARSLERASK